MENNIKEPYSSRVRRHKLDCWGSGQEQATGAEGLL